MQYQTFETQTTLNTVMSDKRSINIFLRIYRALKDGSWEIQSRTNDSLHRLRQITIFKVKLQQRLAEHGVAGQSQEIKSMLEKIYHRYIDRVEPTSRTYENKRLFHTTRSPAKYNHQFLVRAVSKQNHPSRNLPFGFWLMQPGYSKNSLSLSHTHTHTHKLYMYKLSKTCWLIIQHTFSLYSKYIFFFQKIFQYFQYLWVVFQISVKWC